MKLCHFLIRNGLYIIKLCRFPVGNLISLQTPYQRLICVCQSFQPCFLSPLLQLTFLSVLSQPRPTALAFFSVLKVLSPDHCMMASSHHLGFSANAFSSERSSLTILSNVHSQMYLSHLSFSCILFIVLYIFFHLFFTVVLGKKRVHKKPDWLSCPLLYLQGLEYFLTHRAQEIFAE